MAGNEQTPLLDYLYPFKKLNGEIRDSDDAQIIDFGDRLKQDFLDTITHRVSAMVEIPATPSQCGDVDSETADLITNLSNKVNELETELTYIIYLQNSVNNCCDDLLEETLMDQNDADTMLSAEDIKRTELW